MSLLKNFTNRKGPKGGEMAFTDHIEDLRWHIIRSLLVMIAAAIFVFINIEWVFDKIILGPAHSDFIAYKWFCQLSRLVHVPSLCLGAVSLKFQNTALSGQFVMAMSVSMMLGFIISFPYILWELWRFIKPALKTTEIKYAQGIVFWCSLLFFFGVLFAYYILAPYTINFFGNYQLSASFQNIITMDNYYDTMADMALGMGVVFELPVIVYFLTRVGILTPTLMRKNRRYAILILLLLSEVITPPDLFSCFLVFIPLYALFEMSVMISVRVYNERTRKALENN